MFRYSLAWLGLIPIALVNGTLRQLSYGRYLSELAAHQLSSVIGIILFAIYLWLILGIWRTGSDAQSVAIGSLWLILTVLFGLGFGHYVAGHSWSRLLHDYNLFAGRLWLLVVLWIAVAPYIWRRAKCYS